MRHWQCSEDRILREHYPAGGYKACLRAGLDRTLDSIRSRAVKYGIRAPSVRKYEPDEYCDAEIIRHYRTPPTRGGREKLAQRINKPPRWITRRARKLGVLTPRHSDPGWSDDEIELLESHADRQPESLYRIFKKAGYQRSVGALAAKRRYLRMSFPDGKHTAAELARLMGVDGKTVVNWIRRGYLEAERRGTKRVVQGDMYVIDDLSVRKFIRRYTAHVDVRKCDRFWLVEVLCGSQGSKEDVRR